jgi:hypothetical protein
MLKFILPGHLIFLILLDTTAFLSLYLYPIYTLVLDEGLFYELIPKKMSNARINIQWQHRAVCMLVAALLLSCTVEAQLSLKRQKYNEIAARHRNEHAVCTEDFRRLTIKEENGQLTAGTETEIETLFISEKSLNNFNDDNIDGATFSYLTNVNAVAYIPEKNDYKVVKNLDKNGHVSTEYTGLQKNTITRTSYSMVHEEIRMLPGFVFGNSLPTISSVFEVIVPRHVKMGFLLKGADTSKVKRTVEQSGGNTIYRFTANELPAIKEYSDVPSGAYYVTHVIPYVVSFKFPGAKKDSMVSGDITAHFKNEYAFVKGMNLKTDSFLNKKTAELIKHAYSDRDKVSKIFDWVQSNFHYEALYLDDRDGFIPNPADTVCKRMYGDCKDMSSIIMAMCEKAGIPAYFAVIGTNQKPYTHEEVATQHLYNHMICAVKLDGQWVFPDGTSHVQPLGTNRHDIQGKEALIMLNDHDYKIVKIPEEPASKSTTVVNTTMNLTYGDVTGNTSISYTGYPAWEIGDAIATYRRKEEQDILVRNLASMGNTKFIVKNYSLNASDRGNKDVTLNANFIIGGYAQQVKREYFVNMNLNRPMMDMRVNDENRNVAYYIDYKRTFRETVTLNVPKGYRVSYLPKAAKGSAGDLWNYSISYKSDTKNHTVTMTTECVVNTMKIDPDQFEAHNKLVDELKKQYKETVVLTAK